MAHTYASIWSDWTTQAACLRRDTEDWYPDDRHTIREELEAGAAAQAICETCPVRVDCLRMAFDRGEQHGIWGGATPLQRVLVANDPDRIFLLLTDMRYGEEPLAEWADNREVVPA